MGRTVCACAIREIGEKRRRSRARFMWNLGKRVKAG
jgi:hypothetical protein